MFSHVKCSFHSSPLPIFLRLIFIPFGFGKDQGKTLLTELKGQYMHREMKRRSQGPESSVQMDQACVRISAGSLSDCMNLEPTAALSGPGQTEGTWVSLILNTPSRK